MIQTENISIEHSIKDTAPIAYVKLPLEGDESIYLTDVTCVFPAYP